MPRPVTATINLAALQHNFAVAKSFAGNSGIVAVIKANAYGHGVVEVARALADADMYALASLEEAVQLREADIIKPMLLLGGFHDPQDLPEIVARSLEIVIHSQEQLEVFLDSPLATPLRVWLKVDTGMHRLGLATSSVPEAMARLQSSGNVSGICLMAHFATADDPQSQFARIQLEQFELCSRDLIVDTSLCNSAALINLPGARKQWVRPGIMLYGGNPFNCEHPVTKQLKPVMTLASRLVAIRRVSKGESVGYGQRFIAQRDSLIGTVAVGYGDGYPRHAPNGTPVLICGKYAPLAGTVSMDLIGVDLTEIPEARVGDRAILWGEGLSVDTIAVNAGTISYELLTGVSKRVPRQYRQP